MAWASVDLCLRGGGQAIFSPSQIVSWSSEISWKREKSTATGLVTDRWQRWWSRDRTQWMWGSNLADGQAHRQQGMSIAILGYVLVKVFWPCCRVCFSTGPHLFIKEYKKLNISTNITVGMFSVARWIRKYFCIEFKILQIDGKLFW